jgi:hypothetical protein
MAKSNLKGVAHGLLGTFVSRYNDIDGYWGLGVLRKLASENATRMIEIDLLSEQREHEAIAPCKERYRLWLESSIGKFGSSMGSLKVARILLRFEDNFDSHPEVVKDTRGFPYECVVEIAASSKIYTARKVGVCASHDPKLESKSAKLLAH